jgi:hypothetical protein
MDDFYQQVYRKIIYSPWELWFAWRPVKTTRNEYIWLRKIYRRRVVCYADMDEWFRYEYGNIFDILKNERI